jgi:hypothetical protein
LIWKKRRFGTFFFNFPIDSEIKGLVISLRKSVMDFVVELPYLQQARQAALPLVTILHYQRMSILLVRCETGPASFADSSVAGSEIRKHVGFEEA